MSFQVRFNWVDEKARVTSRTYHNTQALIATVLTDLATILPLLNAASMGGVTDVVITQVSTANSFAAIADSNVDKNASIKVLAGDDFHYDFNLPMINSALVLAGGAIDVSDVAVTNILDEFAVGQSWRVNLRNPTDVVSIAGGTLDK